MQTFKQKVTQVVRTKTVRELTFDEMVDLYADKVEICINRSSNQLLTVSFIRATGDSRRQGCRCFDVDVSTLSQSLQNYFIDTKLNGPDLTKEEVVVVAKRIGVNGYKWIVAPDITETV